MSLQLIGPNKAFATSVTCVSKILCVPSSDVIPHIRQQRKSLRTEGTDVRPLPGVDSHVLRKTSLRREPGGTHIAAVRLHTVVRLHVPCVSGKHAECSTALFTLPYLLSAVYSHVSGQLTPLCERLPADVAPVRFLAEVHAMMVVQSTLLRKRLSAVIAPVRPLSRVRSAMLSYAMKQVGGVFTPFTLISAVSADVAVILMYVLVQSALSQTGIVAVGTANRVHVTCRENIRMRWR